MSLTSDYLILEADISSLLNDMKGLLNNTVLLVYR